MRKMRGKMGGGGPGGGRGFGPGRGGPGGAPGGRPRRSAVDGQFGGTFIVYAVRAGEAIPLKIRTGITDMDYSEVVWGLEESDEVLILPSASLVRAQESFQNRMSRRMGIPGLNQNSGRGGGGRR